MSNRISAKDFDRAQQAGASINLLKAMHLLSEGNTPGLYAIQFAKGYGKPEMMDLTTELEACTLLAGQSGDILKALTHIADWLDGQAGNGEMAIKMVQGQFQRPPSAMVLISMGSIVTVANDGTEGMQEGLVPVIFLGRHKTVASLIEIDGIPTLMPQTPDGFDDIKEREKAGEIITGDPLGVQLARMHAMLTAEWKKFETDMATQSSDPSAELEGSDYYKSMMKARTSFTEVAMEMLPDRIKQKLAAGASTMVDALSAKLGIPPAQAKRMLEDFKDRLKINEASASAELSKTGAQTKKPSDVAGKPAESHAETPIAEDAVTV